MSKTLDLIRNAKDGSYVDFRTADNQIDSVPIAEIRALLRMPTEVFGLTDAMVRTCEICDKQHARWMGCDAIKEDDYYLVLEVTNEGQR